MELIRLVEHLSDLVDFEESCARRIAQSKATAQIGNLVVESDIALLAKHSQGCREHIFCRSLLLLVDRNHSIAEIKPSLSLLLVACLLYTSPSPRD